jgi:eukaryotic-like serine/threonine-protein kinase
MNHSTRNEALLREAMTHIDQLLDKSRAERATLLGDLARSRPELHALLLDLLEQEDPVMRGYMEPGAVPSGQHGLHPDSRLGPYRIIRLIGEGGMGEVWLARRDDGLYEGEVAIKTLHPYFAGGALRERFLREAKVLGRLAHTNIARLLDAGIHEGIVYLVLEYVQGRPIDVACNEDNLGVDARLKIFLQLCAGVAHAHSSLVVHRDIKPGNVLLTREGVPKLLDFGIANFHEPEAGVAPSDLTRLTGRIFTPEYAAPEQILGQEITTATDVYSLGVLLYVLLAGKLPYEIADRDRARWEQLVLHEEPRRMSGEIDGDLENIVQKALKKRPEERYPTVAALADDIRRYVSGEPVLAQPDSTWYRLGKFAQRNRLAVGAGATVVIALGVGLAVSLHQLKVARAAQQRAEESNEFIASVFRSADPFYTGKDSMTAAELLALARQRIDRELAAQPRNAIELLSLVGESQLNLTDLDAAEATLVHAIEMAERLQPRDEVLIAEARGRLAMIVGERGDWPQVRALAAQALPALRKHQPRTGRPLAGMLTSLGYAEFDERNHEAAIAFGREALAATTLALGPAHSETVSARFHLATFLQAAKKFDEAIPVAEQVLRDARALAAPGERGALVIQAEGRYGSMLLDAGDPKAAALHLTAATELSAQIYGPGNPSRILWVGELARAQSRLGNFKEVMALRKQAYEGQKPGLLQARSLTNYSRSALAAGMLPEALELLRQATELGKQYDTGKGSWQLLAQADYGAALALSGRLDEADRLLQQTLPLARESAKEGSVVATLNAIGLTRQLQGRWIESEQAFREALAKTSSSDSNQKLRSDALLGIGIARLELGEAADAETWMRQADESIRKTYLGMIPLRADIAMNLGRALLAQGKIAPANESFAVATAFWLEYDASNRSASEAAYWSGQGHLAAAAHREARAELLRAIEILGDSKLPGHVRLVTDARRDVARL